MDVKAYETAERLLRHNRGELVFGGKIKPQWIDGGARFWYSVDTAAGRQFMVVDPHAGERKPVSDPAQLMAVPVTRNPLEVPSPDGKYVVFRQGCDIWVRSVNDDKQWALTNDGDEDHDYGASPDYFMYSRLFQRLGMPSAPPAVAWSPDSARVLTHRTVQEGLRKSHFIESLPADGGPPQLHEMRVALAGDQQMQMAELVVLDVLAGKAIRVNTEPLPMPIMSPIMMRSVWWSDDGTAAYFLSQSDDMRTLRLNRLDPETGEVQVVLTETGPTRVEPSQQPLLGPIIKIHGDDVLWYSQRDGWGHLYRYDVRTGDLLGQITSGEWVVQQILRVDNGFVYFVAAGLVPADPYRRSVCRIGLDGTGFTRLTADDLDHAVALSPNGSYFVDTSSTVDSAPVTVVRDWDGQVLVEVEKADISRLEATGWTPPERFCVKAADGQTDIYGVLYRPHGFDPSRRYPVLDHTYPLPAITRVSPGFDQGWHGNDAEVVAALGFVVIAVDGRGTPGRNKQFHDFSYGQPAAGLADHVAAIQQLAANRPWMDTDRAGIFGTSAGGYGTVRAMLDFPSVFKVGVSESGMHDWRFSDPGLATAYHGPFDEQAYAMSSNVDDAERLEGKLLLMHGGVDQQVSPELTLRLAERLIAAGKDFDLVIMPGADHIYLGYEHYANRRKWDFLVRHLHGSQPPEGYRLTPVRLDAEFLAELFG
ncbi:dipeptidyl aminopeptidase/acylaminoacyl peptidase [Kibdelosporangium banguiense]|uniref:Dipeptidyl aminopeptidase/acylaminoacyl peptidase n=1 Tax=Kibdelosporangium banguiense TaxID=1365924 RepID=A0ABS4TTK2_9PSEU|nr:DPP IV N-terminal domain-containing protein [Kibdelosporangium banguiense]MBP2327717.1 dipeptidyl aminopeptidase/acylaminoacyl peptidase [Kibdelosporangium banguiense]